MIYQAILSKPFIDLDHVVKDFLCGYLTTPFIQVHNSRYTNPYIHEFCTYVQVTFQATGGGAKAEKNFVKKPPTPPKNPPPFA